MVEVFLAPGADDPAAYFELEVSPRGTLFDARVRNPNLDRARLVVDTGWDCPGLRWQVGRLAERQDWWAELELPWSSLLDGAEPPAVWRLNVYRVERPRGGPAEYSCWSPTLTSPADFHRPRHFGRLEVDSFRR